MHVRDLGPAVAPKVAAGLLLAARTLAADFDLPTPSAKAILAATGAGRSRAYERKDAILAFLPTLARPIGRPPSEPDAPDAPNASAQSAITRDVARFLMDHPGAVTGRDRRRYSDGFRAFVLGLREQHPELTLTDFAAAALVPVDTLTDWLRPSAAPETMSGTSLDPEQERAQQERDELRFVQFEQVLDAWSRWEGDFKHFVRHVRRDLRIDLPASVVSDLLALHGARTPKRRPGRSPADEATRRSFETFFGGAQWVGDGKALAVVVDGVAHRFNLELLVDAHTDAFVGVRISDEEDAAAVVNAFDDALLTTNERPLALLLDNRPSNHVPLVTDHVDPALVIRATRARPQNKAHVEGGFGLFAQRIPPLVVDTTDPRELARKVVDLIATTFFRAMNHRPRRDRRGRPIGTRADSYHQPVTPDERERALERLRERQHRQQRAASTRTARTDPVVRQLLDETFARLDLDDPDGRIRDAIAVFARDAIVDGIGIFAGKSKHGTLPPGADARYLLGVVRNVHHAHESDAITGELIAARRRLRELTFAHLDTEHDALTSDHSAVASRLGALVTRAMNADSHLDHRYWLARLADLVAAQHGDRHEPLFRDAARRIHACFRVSVRRRDYAERYLARKLWPVA